MSTAAYRQSAAAVALTKLARADGISNLQHWTRLVFFPEITLPPVRTEGGIVRAYTLSIEFEQNLALATQREYRRMLTKAEARFGDMPIAVLEDPRIMQDFLDWRESIARTSGNREADNRLSAISAMLSWAREHGRAP